MASCNTSRTQSLTFIAMPGPSFVLRPKMAIGTMPHGRVRLEVLGRHGRVYSLLLDVQGLRGERGDGTGSGRPGVPTAVGADRLSLRELRLLAALCEPFIEELPDMFTCEFDSDKPAFKLTKPGSHKDRYLLRAR